MSTIVSESFKDETLASRAIEDLVNAGIPTSEISVLHSDSAPGREFELKENRKVAEGAAVGAVTGGALGGVLLGALGLATLSVPPLGVFVAGPLFAAMAGVGGGGAVGTLVGALVGSGIPEHEAVIAETTVKSGGVLIAVRAHAEQADAARKIFALYRNAKSPDA